jgi:hypothetical protein
MQPLGQGWGVKGMVLRKCDSGGTSKLGFLVLSCRFRLGFHGYDHLFSVCFPNEGVGNHCHKRPMYKLPIASNICFSNAKMEKGCWLDLLTSYCV